MGKKMSTEIVDGKEIQNAVMKAQIEAKMLVVNSPESYRYADTFCVQISEREKRVKADFADAKKKAFDAHRAVCAQEQGHLDGWAGIRKLLKGKMDAWEKADDDRRLAEEARLREVNRKLAEEAAQAQALEAERLGEKALAEAIINAPVIVAPAVVESNVPKAETVIRRKWFAVIENATLIPRDYLLPDEQKLNAMARAVKGPSNIPGVRFESEVC